MSQKQITLTPEQEKMFQPGHFVILHPDIKHPDAGRVGKITDHKEMNLVVEFFRDDLVGSSTFAIIPMCHWLPVGDFFVETYEPRAKKRGWRINDRGRRIFKSLDRKFTSATFGE